MGWTLFWDMHSGGATKIPPYNKIYIEGTEDAARDYFTKRWGRSPDNVSCSCCGEDYSVSHEQTLEQLSGYHRNLRCVETKRGPDGRYVNDDPNVRYLEDGEEPPAGYEVSKISMISRSYGKVGIPLDEYAKHDDVLIVRGDEVLALLKRSDAR